jgi:hypothetical protein
VVTAPGEASFVAAGSTPENCGAPTVQWYSEAPGSSSFLPIGGAMSTSYTTPPTSTAESGTKFEAIFTNAHGETTSNEVTLTVNPPPCSVAPSVTGQPVSQVVTAPAGASFTVAEGAVPANCSAATIQWQVSINGSTWNNVSAGNVSGATSATLSVNPTSISESGDEYRAVLTNAAGPTDSNAATLTVDAAPLVTTNPASKGVVAGEGATFTAAASGTPAPTVQWQVSTNFGSTWTNDTTDSGNATGTLTIVSTTVAENGQEYRAVFTNTAGAATSAPATLTVSGAPVVTINPTSKSVVAGEDATFIAAASGAPTPTVRWQVSTDGGSVWTAVSGAATDTLTVASTTVSESGREYRAVFKNTAGTATSTAATLTVAEKTIAPVVTTNPAGKSVVAGEDATFMAAASGIPTPTVQWQVSTDGGSTFSDDTTDSGNTAGTLMVVATTVAESGYKYRAVFTNTAGTATSTAATLTVNVAPVVTTNPTSKSVVAGEDATFMAAASGTPAPTVQWQVSTNGGSAWTNDTTDSGRATGTLTVAGTTVAISGHEYRAVFKNTAGTATSTAATLTVAEKTIAPVVTTNPAGKSVTAGKGAVFVAAASGIPTPTVQWQVSTDGGSTFSDDTTDSGNTTGTLTIASTTVAENGQEYRAVFTNTAGTATSAAATLTVNAAPVVTINPTSRGVAAGETATFMAAASGAPTPEVQWQESTDGGSGWTAVPGAATDTLTVASTTVSESGREYRAVFTNMVGAATSTAATLTVNALAPAMTPSGPPPVAAFAWFPTAPHTGEPISLASSSTDVASPITSFAWDTANNGAFAAGPPVISISFSTPGSHVVRLRVTDAKGLSSIAVKTIEVASPPLTLMQPFPIVRIAGSDTSSGVKLSLLTVQAPTGARVTAQCRGRGCPVKSESRLAASSKNRAGTVLLTFRRFERPLRAGVILEIRVSKPGEIGKYTSFAIRRNKLPARVDACIGPTNPKPFPCPAS